MAERHQYVRFEATWNDGTKTMLGRAIELKDAQWICDNHLEVQPDLVKVVCTLHGLPWAKAVANPYPENLIKHK